MPCLHPLRSCLCALALLSVGVGAQEPEPEAQPQPEAPIERPALPSRSTSMAADLARQLPPAEVLQLQAGEETFLALWQPANVAEPKGLVILLPGEGESADWPRGIGPLRRGLPDHGWHSLSLSLPDSPPFSVPDAPAAGEETPTPEEPASDDSASEPPGEPEEAGYLPEETAPPAEDAPAEQQDADSRETVAAEPEETGLPERIDARISAALEHARSLQPPTIVLLGQGNGAWWAARHLQQWAPDDVERLALIQPLQPDDQQEPLAQLVPPLKVATGDFYYRDNPSALLEARARLNASRRIAHPAYHQVGLTTLAGEQEQLVRRVRGWLDRPAD